MTVRCEIPSAALAGSSDSDSGELLDDIEAASIFAERDPYRAATHNKGIMNGVSSVVIACGNDFRSVEAGAHAYAAQSGTYSPLSTWRRRGDSLVGELTLPLALGTVGGTLRIHRGAQLALRLAEVEGPTDLAAIAASAGLASNLAALRALAGEGIQRGHMALHARSVAVAAGARADEVELVAAHIAGLGQIDLGAAAKALAALRAGQPGTAT
jgi:hydroxymethylglutaryl-CoA reductase